MMDLCNCTRVKMLLRRVLFLSMLLKIADGFTVKGSSGPLVVPLGGSVLLPCSVDKLLSVEDLEVDWRRSDTQSLISLYQNGEIRPEVQDEDYQDRAHFFSDDIKHGNFSLLLKNVRAEDEGRYTCTVHSGHQSGETEVEIKVEHLMVSGSDELISLYVGKDVTLSCSVDSHIPPEDIEVSWKKRDGSEHILVLLYQNKMADPNSSDERYRDRVEFFSAEIPRGNFSLRLKSVRTEDKGVYMCQVFAGGLSANTTLILKQLGFSALHIMVLILCVAACISAVIICCLIYYTSQHTASEKPVKVLGYFYVFLPNMIMFVAFVLWGVTEGFLYETIFCCTLCLLRPLMLIYVAPFSEVSGPTVLMEFVIFTVVYFSVFFRHTWKTVVHFSTFDKTVVIVMYGLVLLLCASTVILWKCVNNYGRQLAALGLLFLPLLQYTLLFFTFGSASRAGFVVVVILPMFFFLKLSCFYAIKEGKTSYANLLNITSWLILMVLLNAVMAYFYVTSMEHEKDVAEWTYTAVFQQVLWMITIYIYWICNKESSSQAQRKSDVPFGNVLYVFGSVGVVLIIAVALMTELILKTVNGDRALGDLRVIVYPTEGLFTFTVLIFIMFKPWTTSCLQCQQNEPRSTDTSANTQQQNQEHQTAAEDSEQKFLSPVSEVTCEQPKDHN